MVIDGKKVDKQFSQEKFREELIELVKGINPDLDSNIIIDMEY